MSQTASVEEWLTHLSLGEHARAFAENHVSLADLPQLTSDDLKELGVTSLVHRKRILEAIRALSLSTVPDSASSLENIKPAFAAPAQSGGALFIPPIAQSAGEAAFVNQPVPAEWLPVPPAEDRSTPKGLWSRIFTRKFLFVSILAHLLFGLGATYYIVQSDHAKRKLTFQGGPPGTNPSKHALEHKVSMAQKKKTGGAPPQAKRIATTGLSAIALPEMPSMPTATNVAPGMAAGMGGAGMGQGLGFGNGMGSGMGGGGGGGGNFSFFGFRGAGNGAGLIGTLWDLKQTHGHKSTPIGDNHDGTQKEYTEVVRKFAHEFHESVFSAYYKVPQMLSTSQIMVPNISADEGPKAFGAEKEVKPGRWVALYKGKVSPPKTGTYHFVGAGDDVLLVRFAGKLVLDGCWVPTTDWKPQGVYHNGYQHPSGGYVKGDALHVEAGQWYDMEILIGERPGGLVFFCLEVEEEGATYRKGAGGAPVLPLFRTANAKLPVLTPKPPEFDPNGPIWKIQAAGTGSLLDALKR